MQPDVPPQAAPLFDSARIAQDLQIRKHQVESVVQLLDEGNTVPFITRYRKERTGGLDEERIRRIQDRVADQRHLAERRETILKSIESRNALTDELRQQIMQADNPKRLEDLYQPYRPKKRTLADEAKKKGLEPFALAVWSADTAAVPDFDATVKGMLALELPEEERPFKSEDDILTGTMHILAEFVADDADVRGYGRRVFWDTGELVANRQENLAEEKAHEYRDYQGFRERIKNIPPHRILAVNRGKREGILSLKIEFDKPRLKEAAVAALRNFENHPHRDFLIAVVEDALDRLVAPSLERECFRELTMHAENHAVDIFARNLRSLLLQPPMAARRVLGIDPGLRTGCKVAVLDETGKMLEETTVFPHAPRNQTVEARVILEHLIRKYQTPVIAIGNGTACRETEQVVSELIADLATRKDGTQPPVPVKREPRPEPSQAVAPPVSPPEQAPSPLEGDPAKEPQHETEPKHPDEMPAAPSAPSEVAEPKPDVVPGTDPQQVHHDAESPPQAAGEPVPASEHPAEAPIADVTAGADNMPTSGESNSVLLTPATTVHVEAPADLPPASEVPAMESVEAGETPAVRPPQPPRRQPRPPREEIKLPSMDGLELPPADLAYVIVNEAGASDYSASQIAREEFPNYDATVRGTVSIARRLQDPLAELVKIDPQHVGVGLYQHDVKAKNLKESLEGVVESCVNYVGVDLNTASVPLLRHVSGLNSMVARDIVEYRQKNGAFTDRETLKQVSGIGDARFTQAAGFLKVRDGSDPLDATWIHPENYNTAREILKSLGAEPADLKDKEKLAAIRQKLNDVHVEQMATKCNVGHMTIHDILEAIARPGRDPREDLPPVVFKTGILKLEDLTPGMELRGTVLNVVDFGAFVDVGLKDSGLVHISQMANRYIKSPYEVVSVGDVVTAWVLKLDMDRKRVSLSMIPPGTERERPGQRGGQQQRFPGPREGGQRPDGPPQGQQRPPREGGGDFRGGSPRQQAAGQGQGRGGPPRQGGGGGEPRRFDGPPQGQGRGGPPRQGSRSFAPRPPQGQPANQDTPNQPQPEAKPAKPKALPKLTPDALSGRAPLSTFGELAAFFKAKEPEDGDKPKSE